MKTNDEYLKENRIIYFHIAEENDFPDDDGEGWANWNDIIDQQRVNWILREMLTGVLVANGKCTEYDSKKYIDALVEKQLTGKEQSENFFSQQKCNRCGGTLKGGRTMSRMNTDCLCLECAEAEKQHPDYQKAVEAEIAAIRNGNRNFEGIGYNPNGDSIMKIKINQKCLVKVGKNEVEVTVKAQTAKGWLVETAKGRTFPVNDPARFILPEAEVVLTEPESTATPETENVTPQPENPVKSSSGKPSMLEAAVEALKRSGKPMNVKEIIAAMIDANLWEPGPGRTPHLSLSSTIQRNLKKPNSQLPIKKSEERGKFEYTGEAK